MTSDCNNSVEAGFASATLLNRLRDPEVFVDAVDEAIELIERQIAASRTLREMFASEMVKRGLATGHGDTLEELHRELWWQFDEIRKRP